MSFYTPFTSGMTQLKSDRPVDLNAFEIRSRLNRRMTQMAREGINFTQELIDAEAAKIRAEVEAGWPSS